MNNFHQGNYMNQANAFNQMNAQCQAPANSLGSQRTGLQSAIGSMELELSDIGNQMRDNDSLIVALGFLIDDLGSKIEMVLSPRSPVGCGTVKAEELTAHSPFAQELKARNTRLQDCLNRLRDIQNRVSL